MGEQNVDIHSNDALRRTFMKAMLDDAHTLEQMLDSDVFESDVRRIGAEQEMFLVDRACRPVAVAEPLLERLDDPSYTPELAKFNLEANLSPRRLGGRCLSEMESEAQALVRRAGEQAQQLGANVVLAGTLPTLTQADLTLDNMIQSPRYYAMNEALMRLRGSDFQVNVQGIDRLEIRHTNFMLESCNASFQVHFQVAPDEFAHLYNIAQAVTAPVLAAAVNSPLLFNHRLWHETRIALFEHSVDTRSQVHQARGLKPRVHFGDQWVNQSVIEIFREDIARFRVVLTGAMDDPPSSQKWSAGEVPQLRALRLHSGTVYRWNRACYGIMDGVPHLRIEQRVLPAGPSVADEMANAAFFFGLLAALSRDEEHGDIRDRMSFSAAKGNFFAAARDGLKAQLVWWDERQHPAAELILDQLAPMARDGLDQVGIDAEDRDRYIGIIEKRVAKARTGARWLLESYDGMGQGTADQKARQLVGTLIRRQASGKPIHEWRLARFSVRQDWRESFRTVDQFMTTDLFTVRTDDLIDYAASIMDWEHLRHVPVEDDQGLLVGLVSHRALLRVVARGIKSDESVSIGDIMQHNPRTCEPGTPTVEAIRLMRDDTISCLPVVKDGHLIGIVTEHDLITIAAKLLEQHLDSP